MPQATRKEVESLLATILKQLVPRSDEKLVHYHRRILRQLQSECRFRKEWASRNWFKELIRTAFDASVIFVLWQPRNRVESNVHDHEGSLVVDVPSVPMKRASTVEVRAALQRVLLRLVAANVPFDTQRVYSELDNIVYSTWSKFEKGVSKKKIILRVFMPLE